MNLADERPGEVASAAIVETLQETESQMPEAVWRRV
jgi:hypothetical protein